MYAQLLLKTFCLNRNMQWKMNTTLEKGNGCFPLGTTVLFPKKGEGGSGAGAQVASLKDKLNSTEPRRVSAPEFFSLSQLSPMNGS